MRKTSVAWTLFNYREVMMWRKDLFLEGLVHDAQIYARQYKWFNPDPFAEGLDNSVNEVLEYLSKQQNQETAVDVISSLISRQEGKIQGKDLVQGVEVVKQQIKCGIAWFAKNQADSGEVFEDKLLADPEAYVEWAN